MYSTSHHGWNRAPTGGTHRAVTVADAAHEELFQANLDEGQRLDPSIAEITVAEACALFPPLRQDRFVRAMIEPDSRDIDVAGLHQTFLRGFRALGGEVVPSFRVDSATRPHPGGGNRSWRVASTVGAIEADVVINAAGAWGDLVAETAGVKPLGLAPKRRTAFMVGSDYPDSARWPMVATVEHSWYAKPDGPQLLCSPANEDPAPPSDVKPEETDIALAIETINADTTLGIRSVRSAWAGLRTFSPDRGLVLGPDPDQGDFYWCVGQGGIGIQTAPAAGRYLAELILHGRAGRWADEAGIDPGELDPARFNHRSE